MYRLLLLLVVATVLSLYALPAAADLYVVQSWSLGGTPVDGICYDSARNHIWLTRPYSTYPAVDEYTRTGNLVDYFYSAALDVSDPMGLEFHEATEDIWVTNNDGDTEEVVRFDRDREVVNRFSIDAFVNSAYGIAFNTYDGHLYVCDLIDYKITEWTTGGFYKGVWINLSFQPHGICYLNNEGTFLVNNNNHRVYKLTATGLISHVYDMEALLGIVGLRGMTYDRVSGTVFLVAWDRTVYEIAGFTSYTGVDDPARTQTSWSAIKALYR